MARRYHHHVYVVALSLDVLYEPRFRRANPDYVTGKPCVYVGMTGLTPDGVAGLSARGLPGKHHCYS
jgi:hypothetical protein